MEEAIGGEEEEGGGAPGWLATFADLMSLLLAFFVLLFSFSSVDDQMYKEVGGSMKDAFGVQSRMILTGPVMGTSFIAEEFSSGRPDPKTLNIVPQENLDLRKKWNSDQLKAGKSEEEDQAEKKAQKEKISLESEVKKQSVALGKEKEKAKKTQDSKTGQAMGEKSGLTASHNASVSSEELNRVAQFASKKAKQLGKELASDIANGSLSVETTGNKVIIRVAEDASFPPGSAATYKQFDSVIEKISEVVKESPGKVIVEGHTDNIPITSTQFRSNWELSASRAATVVHGLINGTGLPVNRFEVRGLADAKPIASNRTARGRAKNRRVEVILEYSEKDLVPLSLKSEIKPTEEELQAKKQEKKEDKDPLLDLYRGFNNSLENTPLQSKPSPEADDYNMIFHEDFFR